MSLRRCEEKQASRPQTADRGEYTPLFPIILISDASNMSGLDRYLPTKEHCIVSVDAAACSFSLPFVLYF